MSRKSTLFLSNSWYPFDVPPFLDQEVLHVLVNLPIGSTSSDTVITGKPQSVLTRADLGSEEALPVSEHPEPETPHFILRQHIQQMSRIREMDVVIATPMSQQVVHVVEPGNVRD